MPSTSTGADRRIRQGTDQPQQTVPARSHPQQGGQARPGPPSQREPERLQHPPQQPSTPSVRAGQTRDLLGERTPGTRGVIAEEGEWEKPGAGMVSGPDRAGGPGRGSRWLRRWRRRSAVRRSPGSSRRTRLMVFPVLASGNRCPPDATAWYHTSPTTQQQDQQEGRPRIPTR